MSASIEQLQKCIRCQDLCQPGLACVSGQAGHPDAAVPCKPSNPNPEALSGDWREDLAARLQAMSPDEFRAELNAARARVDEQIGHLQARRERARKAAARLRDPNPEAGDRA